jgi:hypothetical protein
MGFANQEGVYFNSGENPYGVMANEGEISDQWQQIQGQRFSSFNPEGGNFASSNLAGGN